MVTVGSVEQRHDRPRVHEDHFFRLADRLEADRAGNLRPLRSDW